MEIGIFSKCVKDLIVDLDKVAIPGLGVFFAEDVPASFSDKGNTINPPSRRMYFKREDVPFSEDALIFKVISESLNVSAAQAQTELDWCLSRIHSELSGNRCCVLPGLGELKSSSSGEYFFIPDEDLDICIESFGLEPVCVKLPVQASREATAPETPAVPEEPEIRETPEFPEIPEASQPVPDTDPAEEFDKFLTGKQPDSQAEPQQSPGPQPTEAQVQPAVAPHPGPQPQSEKKRRRKAGDSKHKNAGAIAVIVILTLILVLIIAYNIASHFYPEEFDALINSLLYSPEELEILGR